MKRQHVYAGSPDVEDLLLRELRHTTGDVKVVADGVVVVGGNAVVDPVFARQVLTDARFVKAQNQSELATAVLDVGGGDGVGGVGPVSLDEGAIDVDAPDVVRAGSQTRTRHHLADEAARLKTVLQKKTSGRREQGKIGPPTAHRLRMVLTGPHEGWCSAVRSPRRDTDDPLTAWPSPFPLGRALVEEAKDAPSSAHRKLDEALRWLDVSPGADDRAVDLGAAPGGWTRVLRNHGASVIAVDRANMDEALVRDPGDRHLKKDAGDVDLAALDPTLLVCDVIWEPEKALAVITRSVALPRLRALVVTLKLRHPVDFTVIAAGVALATGTDGFAGRVKHLLANKLEVTVLMRRD